MITLDDVMAEPWEKNFPKAIQIETQSNCNSRCLYCPYSITSKKFKNSKLTEESFLKILEELKLYEPKIVAPYLNNEPLMDKDIIIRLWQIRKILPKTFIDLATNGSLLNRELSIKLIEKELRIDEIKINIPSTDPEKYKKITGLDYKKTLDNIRNFINLIKNKGFNGIYRIVIVSATESKEEINFWRKEGIEAKIYKKISRGGIIDTGMLVKEEINGCKYNREKEWVHILSNGQVVLCCMDWNRQYILGDINEQSISEIWNSKKYSELRIKIQKSVHTDFICNNCEWGIKYVR
jgi:radical SAM protein with 4Fe4S-binding SPASM domain